MQLSIVRTATLDLSSCTGYAVGGAGGIEFSGSRQLPKTGDDCGEYLCAFRGWLTSFIQKNGIKRVVFEAPILDRKNGLIAVKKMTGLANVTEMVCRDLGVECFESPLSSIRVFFIGVCRAPSNIDGKELRRKWLKQRVMYECRQRGHTPGDDNEGDAIAIFYFVKALTDPLRKANISLLVSDPVADAEAADEEQAA